MKKVSSIVLLSLSALVLSSCTINDNGDFELTWLFWVLLAILAVFIISGISSTKSDNQAAKEQGITPEEYAEQKEKKQERQEMASGLNVQYLGGCPKWATPCTVNFSILGSDIILFKNPDKFKISRDMIAAISNEKSSSRSVGKTAAGAIVGGVLTGGVGLIVGGALGARKKNTSEIYITYKYNGVELTLNLQPGKNVDKVYAWINTIFAEPETKTEEKS